MRRPTALLAAIVAFLLVSSAGAERIQKWKTPDGKLYFGDRPPPGSTKIGEEGRDEPAGAEPPPEQSTSAPSPEQEKRSIEYSRTRTQIQRELNGDAEHLEELDKRIGEVQRQPNFVPQWMERRAGIKDEKTESLDELKSDRHSIAEAMVSLWKRFDDLDAEVKKAYGGNAPVWWRSSLSCPKCPSRQELERAP